MSYVDSGQPHASPTGTNTASKTLQASKALPYGDVGASGTAQAAHFGLAGPQSAAAATSVQKRVTRSSMGGPGSTSREDFQPKPYLPPGTPVLITVSLPSDARQFPIKLLPADEAMLSADAIAQASTEGSSECRLLRSDDDFLTTSLLGRSNVPVDTSDAFYQRLHRYPEVLEKRSARLEKERLIHERNKLVMELEELRGRSWVYTGAQGGKSEEDRRRRIREMEDRLARYDILLPNQPRKSNALNSVTHVTAGEAKRRSESPAVSAKSRPGSRDGSTKIKLSFGGSSYGARGAPYRGGGKTKLPPRRRPSHLADDDSSDGSGVNAVRQSKGKSKARSIKPARPSDAKRPRTSLNHWQLISEDELDDSDDGEHYHNPNAKRIRLPDSFFSNPSLRDQYLASFKSRRQSSRLLYAFGQRLPDEVEHQEEFVPHGGTSGILSEDTAPGFSQKTLEEMIAERGGEKFAVVNGIVVPKSAVDAYGTGPVISVTNSMSKSAALERAAAMAAQAQTPISSSTALSPQM
ncbi:hypothetical protein OIV83_001667 [Microbotryomycetes sp. JL201]|nr:hypothetical protein OIV83_001667 [Microbotryomycetes sp. JL201]